MKHYTDKFRDDCVVRTFSVDSISENELEWHRDEKDRFVTILNGSGWYFQFDNSLPFTMNVGDTIFIKKDLFHRIHKGNEDLVIEIKE
jgi:oxalate decarboxylase/phosphoglucose isomerase-like protein (cupin superfamily)